MNPRDSMAAILSIAFPLKGSAKRSKASLKASSSFMSVVMSLKSIPFLGKSGMDLILSLRSINIAHLHY